MSHRATETAPPQYGSRDYDGECGSMESSLELEPGFPLSWKRNGACSGFRYGNRLGPARTKDLGAKRRRKYANVSRNPGNSCTNPPPNLVIYGIENNTYEVTGNQLIPGGDRLSMTTLAKGAGILHAYQIDSVKGMNETLPEILDQEGPIFINLLVETGQEPPPALDRPLKLVSSEFRDTLTRSSKKR